jgi:hypothetical protein
MSLERLAARGDVIGAEAVERTRDRIVAEVTLPSDIDIGPSPNGIVLSGKRLRRRIITDPQLRKFPR